MKYIRIGKIVNTHGIKGELRILSDFKYKDKVFKKDMKFYVGKDKKEFIVNSYRFLNEEDIKLDDGQVLSNELIGYKVFIGEKDAGIVTDIIDTPANEVIKANVLIPYVKEFINKIDKDNKIIYVNDVRGLM